MRRACKVTLKYLTQKKHRHLCALLEAYRAAVNFYIRSLWETPGKLNKETLARLQRTRLSERYKSQALKQALETVIATKKAAKETGVWASCPVFMGKAVLDAKFVSVETGQGSFDLVVRFSSLHKGHKLTIPTRKTAVINKWLACPEATLIQGCALGEDALILWIEVPEQEPPQCPIRVLGVDVGVNKLLTDSNGATYGTDFKRIRNKIVRRQPGSRQRRKAFKERDNYINFVLNQFPWASCQVLGVEALSDMKRGKQRNRGKAFRKAMAPWTYRRVLTRIGHKAQENRVRLVAVPPEYTSQTCPVCSTVSKNNRKGENFFCVCCGYTADADHVGAQTVLARTLREVGSVESPTLQKKCNI